MNALLPTSLFTGRAEEYKAPSHKLRRAVKDAKGSYRERVESQFQGLVAWITDHY